MLDYLSRTGNGRNRNQTQGSRTERGRKTAERKGTETARRVKRKRQGLSTSVNDEFVRFFFPFSVDNRIYILQEILQMHSPDIIDQ